MTSGCVLVLLGVASAAFAALVLLAPAGVVPAVAGIVVRLVLRPGHR